MNMSRFCILLFSLVFAFSSLQAVQTGSTTGTDPLDEGMFLKSDKAAGVLLIETNVSPLDSMLTALGAAHDIYTGTDWSSLWLPAYTQIFLALDGGVPGTADMQALADYADQGGVVHILGGTATSQYAIDMDTYLLDINAATWTWTQNAVDPDIGNVNDLHFLGRNLSPYNFVTDGATYYTTRIEDTQATVLAENGDGDPVLVTKKIGAGRLDLYIYSPKTSYYGNASDMAVLGRIVANMYAGPSPWPEVAVVGNTRQYVTDALTDLGVDFMESISLDVEYLDLSPFRDVFFAIDGGLWSEADVLTLADYANSGGALHLLGGSATTVFTNAVDAYLIGVDTASYWWFLNSTSPDVEITSAFSRLARNLPATYEFIMGSATYFQLKITDPGAGIVAVNGDGYPILADKVLGAGRLDLCTNTPGHYNDAGDYLWFRQLVENMLGRGIPGTPTVSDVPNDQGRAVRLTWLSSEYDTYGSPVTIMGYGIWRRSDSGETKAYPPGSWDYVATVPARGETVYQTVVPTLCDSTEAGVCTSDFFISATTASPLVYFDSPVGSGYSIDNLAPSVPTGLRRDIGTLLVWDEPVDPDFRYFTVYGSDSDALDGSETLLTHTIEQYADIDGQVFDYYLLTATDLAGNESEAAPLSAYADVPAVASLQFALHPNIPNPFNPSTEIRFTLPVAGAVRLSVYDLSGGLVKRLVDGNLAAGQQKRSWAGDDQNGARVASGTYFLRLETDQGVRTRKVLLAK